MSRFVIDTTHDIINLFRSITENLHSRRIKAECVLDGNITVTAKDGDTEKLRNMLSQTAADFIAGTVERRKINGILSDYGLGKNEVFSVCEKLENDGEFCRKRSRLLGECFKKHMESSDKVYVDGLANFGFREYKRFLEAEAEEAAEEYMAEKAYIEFLDLLKYFVSIRTGEIPEVCVYGVSGLGYMITDEKGNIIDDKCYDEFFEDETNVTQEDMLISRLISIAPRRIRLCGIDNEKTVEAIKHIFAGRINIE